MRQLKLASNQHVVPKYLLCLAAIGSFVSVSCRKSSLTFPRSVVRGAEDGVKGIVIDSSGEPIKAFIAEVRLLNKSTQTYEQNACSRVASTDGAFVFSAIPEGEYAITVSTVGYPDSTAGPFVSAKGSGILRIAVRMNMGGSITGTVLNAYTGLPIEDAEVGTSDMLFSITGIPRSAFDRLALSRVRANTNRDGAFSLQHLTPGTYSISVSAHGFASIRVRDMFVAQGQITDAVVPPLVKGARIVGTTFDAAQRLLSNVQVDLCPAEADQQLPPRTVYSNAPGRYEILNVLPGKYTILIAPEASHDPFRAIDAIIHSGFSIVVKDAQEYNLDLRLAH